MPGSGDSRLEPDSTVAHRYRIVRHCGDRGFGQIYEAEDSATEARVALMRLHSEFSHPRVRDSFFETRGAATVGHERVVDINDYGEDLDGRLFLTMPWIPGARGLDEWLASRGPLPWARVEVIIEQIAEALEAAHQRGVLHGGLEFSRILIDADEAIHVVDFGLAPALTRPGGRPVTNTGPLPGNPHYLAPEQIRGEANDTRSDVYALGIMLWELITGQPPFVGDPMSVANAQLEDSLPELVRRDAPAEIEPLLFLALTKDKEERLASAAEFATLLRAMPSGRPSVGYAPTEKIPATPKPAPAAAVPPPVPAPDPIAAASPPVPAPEPAPAPIADPVPAAAPEPSRAADGPPPSVESDAADSNPEVAPVLPLAPPPAPAVDQASEAPENKRGLGKLQWAILLFLAFDVLVVAAFLVFGNGPKQDEAELATQDAGEQPGSPDASPPEAGTEEPSKPAAEATGPKRATSEPATDPSPASLSVEQAVAAALPPEPESIAPVRPLPAGLTDKDFREAMVDSREGILAACTDSRMRRTLKVQLKVAPEGKVSYARVMGGLSDTSLGRCVTKKAYGIDFPETAEGGTHVYTLRLR